MVSTQVKLTICYIPKKNTLPNSEPQKFSKKTKHMAKKLDVPCFSVPSDNRAATRLSSEMQES